MVQGLPFGVVGLGLSLGFWDDEYVRTVIYCIGIWSVLGVCDGI